MVSWTRERVTVLYLALLLLFGVLLVAWTVWLLGWLSGGLLVETIDAALGGTVGVETHHELVRAIGVPARGV